MLGEAANTRAECARLEQDIEAFKRMMDSPRYAEISEQTKENMTRQLTELESQGEMKKTELNSIFYRLLDSDFWPVSHKAPETSSSDERFRDLRVLVWDLRDNVAQIQAMMKHNVSASSATTSGELTSDDLPAVKRPRVSDMDVDEVKKPSTPSLPPDNPVVPAIRPMKLSDVDFSELYERFDKIDSRLSDLENSMVQFDNEMLVQMQDEVETQLDEKFSTLKLNPSAAAATGQDLGEDNKKLWDAIASLDRDVTELSQLSGSLHHQSTTTQEEIAHLRTENASLKERIASVRASVILQTLLLLT